MERCGSGSLLFLNTSDFSVKQEARSLAESDDGGGGGARHLSREDQERNSRLGKQESE